MVRRDDPLHHHIVIHVGRRQDTALLGIELHGQLLDPGFIRDNDGPTFLDILGDEMVQYQVIEGLVHFRGFDHWECHLQTAQESPCIQQLLLVFLIFHKVACSHHATCLDPGVAPLYQ